MKSCDLSLMASRCFGAHFRVPMKDHEKTYHKSDNSQKLIIVKRQIMNIFMFAKNLLWLICMYEKHFCCAPNVRFSYIHMYMGRWYRNR
jgi:hypothetical protein